MALVKIYEATSDNVLARTSPNADPTNVAGSVAKGSTLEVTDEQNGYVKTQYGWVSSANIRLVSIDGNQTRSAVKNAVSRATGGNTIRVSNSSNASKLSNNLTGQYIANTYKVKTTLDKRLLDNANALCVPPQFNAAADPQIFSGYKIGRVHAESVLSNAIIVSMCPCKVKYLPTFSKEEQKSLFDTAMQAAGDSSIAKNLGDDWAADGSGNFYEATGAWNTHINRVNAILRLEAIMMGIGDKLVPGTKIKYKNMSWDLPFGSIADPAIMRANTDNTLLGGLTKLIKGAGAALSETFQGVADDVLDDGTWVHFYADGDNTSYSDDHSTTTKASAIEGMMNSLDDLVKEFNFLLGEVHDNNQFVQDISTAIDSMGDSAIANFVKTGKGYFEGARLAFPQILDTSEFRRSISVNVKCVAPCGDPEAIFLYTSIPRAHIMSMALPGQYSANMYTFPPLVKINCKGWFNCDLAVISDLRITRGGSDNRAWTRDRLATEIDISFSVTPLYSQLMVPTTKKPFSALSNRGFIEYIAATSGVDMKMNNAALKAEMVGMMLSNRYNPIDKNFWSDRTGGLYRSFLDSFITQTTQKITHMP